MKLGKVKHTIVDRSIVKNLKHTRKEVLEKPGVGVDAARIEMETGSTIVTAIATVAGKDRFGMDLAIHRAVNNVYVKGGRPIGVSLAITFPEFAEEARLKEVMERANIVCAQLGIDIIGGHTTVLKAVKEMVITVSAIGEAAVSNEEYKVDRSQTKDADIVLTKWVGMEATILLTNAKMQELNTRYTKTFLEGGSRLYEHLSLKPEMDAIKEESYLFLHDVGEGGIFGALWELGEYLHAGMEVNLKNIPMKQETVEVCDFYDLNPYMLQSGGSMLIVTKAAGKLIDKLEQAGIKAAVIGHLTDGNDRIVKNEDETRFIEPFRFDEIYKAL
ncbi:MAG: hypothetical protein E7256_05315 [Lachnospiraceae bacterium]|nr:hypothetical protein [Lachnospiraceae bacterium]